MAKQLNVSLSFTADTEKAKAQIRDLQNALNKITQNVSKTSPLGLTEDINSAIKKVTELQSILQRTTTETGSLDLGQFNQELKKANLSAETIKSSLVALGPEGQATFAKLAQSISMAEVPLKRTNGLLAEFATTLKNTARWQLSSSILHGFIGSIQSAYRYAQDLNSSLNDIRIVTGQSTEQMAEFAKRANESAKALSSTTTAYTDAALIFYQQGLDDKAVQERTDTVIKMSNVTGEAVKDVSSYMTAIWNNFDDGSQSLEHYADVITALGAATASSSEEIANGLEKFASIGKTVGLSYDYATAALATVVASTRQSEDVVGTAFKTIFSRIQGLKLGETLEDDVDLNKYSQALKAVGVEVVDASGELRDLDNILDDLADKWDLLTSAQQTALAQTVAGTRQYAQFIALMSNWDFMEQNLEVAKNSEGSLQEQMNRFEEGWEGARKRLQASAQAIYQDLIDDQFFIKLTDATTKIVNGIHNVIKSIGGLKGIIPIVSSLLLKMFGGDVANAMNNFIYNIQLMSNKGRQAIIDRRKEFNDALLTMKEDMDDFTSVDLYSKRGQIQNEIIEKTVQLNSLGKELTENEKEQLNYLLDINNAYLEATLESKKELDNIQEQNNKLKSRAVMLADQMPNSGITNGRGVFLSSSEVKEELDQLHKIQTSFKEIEQLKDEFFKASSDIGDEKAQQQLRALREEIEKIAPAMEDSEGYIAYFEEALDKLANAKGPKEVEEAFVELEESLSLLGDERLNLLIDGIEGTDTVSKQLKKTLEDLLVGFNKEGLAIVQNAKDADAYNKSIDSINKALQSFKGTTLTFSDTFVALGSSMSSFAMYLNSIKSLIDAFTDPDVKGIEKLTAILMSAGMVFNGLMSTTKNFGKVIGGINDLINISTLKAAKKVALLKAESIQVSENTMKEIEYYGVQKLKNLQDGESVVINGKVVQAEELRELSTKELTAAIHEMSGAELEHIGIMGAETKGLKEVTKANKEAKASSASNVYLLAIAAAIAVIVGGLTLWSEHLKTVAENEEDLANRQLESVQERAQSIEDHIQKISELNDEYDELSNKYEQNEISLSSLQTETYYLCQKYGLQHEALQVLVSDYKDINELIKKSIKIAANQEIIDNSKDYNDAIQRKLKAAQYTQNSNRDGKDKWGEYLALLGDEKVYSGGFGGALQYNTGFWTDQSEADFINSLMDTIGISDQKAVKGEGVASAVDFSQYGKEITKNWDEILKIFEEYANLSDNNVYKTFKVYFENIEEIINTNRDRLEKEEAAKLENIGLEKYTEGDIKNYSDYEKTRNLIAGEAWKTSQKEDLGLFENFEEATKWANEFLSQYDEVRQYINEYNFAEAVKDQFNASGEAVDTYVETLKTAATQSAVETSIDIYKNALQEIGDKGLSDELRSQMKSIVPEDFDWEAFDESSKIEQIQLINELLLAQNDLIIENAEARQQADAAAAVQREQDIETLKEQLKSETEKQIQLQEEIKRLESSDVEKSDLAQQQLEDKKKQLEELEEKIKDVTEALQNLQEEGFDFKFDGIEESFKVLDNLVDSILSGAEAFQSAAELIGEGFTVAAENVDELNALFPALLENATVADNGIVTLNEEVVQSYLNGYDEILKANTEETANQLRNEIAIVDAELEFQQTKMNLIAEALAGKKSASDAEQEIAEAEGKFESTVSNEVLKVDVGNAQIGNDTHAAVTNDQLSFLDAIDNRIHEVSEHFAKMLSGSVVPAGSSTPVAASLVTGYVPTVYEGPVAESLSSDKIDELQSEYTEAANRVNELTRLRGDLVEDLANLLSGSSNASSALQGAASGAGGKTDKSKGSGSKGSKKQKETKELKEFFDEFDQFYPLTKAIEDVTDALNDLGKQQEHLSGQNLINSLKKQNDLLQKQHKIYRDLIKQQQDYRDSLAGMLQSFGATFDAETGNISNYMELTATNLQKYNEAVITYNNSAQDEAAKKALSLAERNYKAFKDYLSKYQKILTDIEDTQNNLDDILYEQIENNFKAFEVDIQLDLDLEDAKRQINDFIRDINVDFRKAFKSTKEWTDLFDVAAKNSKTYSEAGGTIDTDLKKLREIAEIIDNPDYNYMTSDSMFADRTEAIKAYKDASDQLMKDGKDFYELYKSSWDSYLSAIDEANKEWDEVVAGYDKINKTLDHYQKITELLYDEESDVGREYLDQLYEVSEQASLAKQSTLKAEIESLQKEYDEILAAGGDESEEDLKKIAAQIEKANDDLDSEIESYLQTIQTQLVNSIHSIMSAADKAMTGGYGIQTISERWQDAQKAAEGYYDDVERIYQLQKAENNWQDLINSTKNLKTQQYLKNIMDSQLENLKSKTKLSEYDVQLAEKELEVQKAYAALQDSQNNKNSMKLVRNKQGNWSYQYVADQDDVANKQQNFLDALNEKYTFTKEQSEKAVESLMNLYTEANDRLTSLLEEYKYADEDRRAKIEEEYNYLYETYYGSEGLIAQKAQECSDMQNDIAYTMMQSLEGHYEVNKTNFENMTIAQQELFGELRDSGITNFEDLSLKLGNKDAEDTIYGSIYKNAKEAIDEQDGEWKTLARDIVTSWAGEENKNSVSAVIQNVYETAKTKVQEYDDKIKKSEFASGQNWTDVKTEGDKAAASIAGINKQLDDLLAKNEALSTYKGIVDSIGTQWDGVKDSIEKATKATEDYLEALREPSEATPPDYVEDVNPQGEYNTGTSSGSGGGGNGGSGGGGNGNKGSSGGGKSTDSYTVYYEQSGTGLSYTYDSIEKAHEELSRPGAHGYVEAKTTTSTGKQETTVEGDKTYGLQIDKNKKATVTVRAYATGGYTGDWNSTDGRLAILHEKELVLNKEDTSNILDAVNTVRGISNLSNLVSNVISSNLVGMALGLSGLSPNGVNANTTSNSNNVFNITAEFPNAENVNEIREAILSLPTLASQYLSQR